MGKYRFVFIVLFLLGSCYSNQIDSNKIDDSIWVTDLLVDEQTNDVTLNLVLSFVDGESSIHQFGTGIKLFKSLYKIKDNKMFLDGKSNPFMKFLEIGDNEMTCALFPGDTTRFRKVKPNSKFREVYLGQIINHTFKIENINTHHQRFIYFDENEILEFSNEVIDGQSESADFSFKRTPYHIDLTHNIPTIIIGNLEDTKVEYSPEGEIELNDLIIGMLNVADSNSFNLKSFKSKKSEEYMLTPLRKNNSSLPLASVEWKLGGRDKMIFNFKRSGELELTEIGERRDLTWNFDDSGFLIVMTEKSGEKLFAINNFQLNNKRIGFEIKKGIFIDLLGLKK